MTGVQFTQRAITICSLLLFATLPAPPARAAPAPEETALNSPWFPGTLSAGGYHTCGLRANGTLVCWGDNNYGQSSPPAGTFIHVSTGTFHSCGLRASGIWICWGDDYYNQLSGIMIRLPLIIR